MTAIDSLTEERLRRGFKKYLNPFMLTMWRLGLGRWFKVYPEISGNVLVLIHIGRKTGIKRYQPLNFALADDDIYCVAGFGSVSDWYRNIQVNPNVEVWLPDGWWTGVAEDLSDSPRRIQLIRKVLIGSGLAAQIFGLNPHNMSDKVIEKECKNYRLIRIQRNAACTGSGGPGELEWIWQLTTIILLGLILLRRKG